MSVSPMDNRSLLAKADLALSDLTSGGGLLQPAQAAKFMRIMIKESRLLGLSTVVPMRSPKQDLPKIKFGSRILRAGAEATPVAAGDRQKPDFSYVELDAKLFKGEVRLSNEVLEDSIEQGELKNTIMQLMAERVALDTEEVAINGDTASADPFLAQFDGVLKQATSHVYDHAPAADSRASKALWKGMLKLMPQEYRRDRRNLRFLTSGNAELDYRDSLSDRATALGDKYLETDPVATYAGIPVLDVPLFPENLGGGTNETAALLLDPKNINLGVWREIRVETDKDVSAGTIVIVVSMRVDCKYAHEDAVVKGTGITFTAT